MSRDGSSVLSGPPMDVFALVFAEEIADGLTPAVSLSLSSSTRFAENKCPNCTMEPELVHCRVVVTKPGAPRVRVFFYDVQCLNSAYYRVAQWSPHVYWTGGSAGPLASDAYLMDRKGQMCKSANKDIGRRLVGAKGFDKLMMEAAATKEGFVDFLWLPDLLPPPPPWQPPMSSHQWWGTRGAVPAPMTSGPDQSTPGSSTVIRPQIKPVTSALEAAVQSNLRRFRPIVPRPPSAAKGGPADEEKGSSSGDMQSQASTPQYPGPQSAEGNLDAVSDDTSLEPKRPKRDDNISPLHELPPQLPSNAPSPTLAMNESLQLAEMIQTLDSGYPDEFNMLQW